MSYEKKPGQGSLFINKKKQKDSHPDRQGDALVHCPHCSCNFEVEIAGWLKQSEKAGQFLSLSVKSKDDPGAYRGTERKPTPDIMEGDEIPF